MLSKSLGQEYGIVWKRDWENSGLVKHWIANGTLDGQDLMTNAAITDILQDLRIKPTLWQEKQIGLRSRVNLEHVSLRFLFRFQIADRTSFPVDV